MIQLATPFDALSLVLRIGSVGVIITSLEDLARPSLWQRGGLLDPTVQLVRNAATARVMWRLRPGRVAKAHAVLSVLRVLAAISLLAGGGDIQVARFGCLAIAVATLLQRFVSPIGSHASGALVALVFSAAALGLCVGSRQTIEIALAFIAAEACLAYFVTGYRKLEQPIWRRGKAIQVNARSLEWGNRHSAKLWGGHPRIAFVACWMTIVGECSVPLALVVPLPVAIALLASAGFFHVSVAIEMGLNSFLWAFVSTYPAILFCWYFLHGVHG